MILCAERVPLGPAIVLAAGCSVQALTPVPPAAESPGAFSVTSARTPASTDDPPVGPNPDLIEHQQEDP